MRSSRLLELRASRRPRLRYSRGAECWSDASERGAEAPLTFLLRFRRHRWSRRSAHLPARVAPALHEEDQEQDETEACDLVPDRRRGGAREACVHGGHSLAEESADIPQA